MNYTERFLKFFQDFVLPHETVFAKGHHGDYAYAISENVSGDAGGLTKFGIDQRSHPRTDIKNLTLEDAKKIYWLEYWLPVMGDHLPDGYGEALADIKINGGNGVKMLQQGLNTTQGIKLTVDGKLGPMTEQAMVTKGRYGLAALLRQREARYRLLAKKNPQHKKFLQGWLNRNNDLAKFVGVSVLL